MKSDEKLNKLKGIWHLSIEKIGNIESKCNICPEVKFSCKGIGKVIKPSKEEINFKYAFSSEKNKVTFSFKENQHFFDETDFVYKTYTVKNLEFLELRSVKGKRIYILSREE